MHPAGVLEPEETTCTTRTEKSYAWREIIDMKALNEMSPCSEARARRGCSWMELQVLYPHPGCDDFVAQGVFRLLSIGGGAPQDRLIAARPARM